MKKFYSLLLLCALVITGGLVSCDDQNEMRDTELAMEQEVGNKTAADSLFTVSFVNTDGTPYFTLDDTKEKWSGTRTSYPYRTPVSTDWGTFCSGTGDYVTLSGGDSGRSTLSSSGSTYNITNAITKDYTVSVAKGYTITCNASTGGSISPSGAQKVDAGSSLTLTATPSSGYEFSKFITSTGWEITTNNKVVTPSASYTVTAYFKQKVTTPDYYTLTITVQATAIEVGKSESITFTATNVYSSGSGGSTRNVTVSKSGRQTVTFAIKAGQTTTVSASSRSNNYGHYFSGSGGESTSVTMSGDKSVTYYVNY